MWFAFNTFTMLMSQYIQPRHGEGKREGMCLIFRKNDSENIKCVMLPTGAAKLGHEQHVPANKVVSVHSSVQIVVRAVTTCRTTPPHY